MPSCRAGCCRLLAPHFMQALLHLYGLRVAVVCSFSFCCAKVAARHTTTARSGAHACINARPWRRVDLHSTGGLEYPLSELLCWSNQPSRAPAYEKGPVWARRLCTLHSNMHSEAVCCLCVDDFIWCFRPPQPAGACWSQNGALHVRSGC